MPGGEPGSASDAVLQRMMHPKSVAIIGMSAKPNTAGHAVLRNWLLNEFTGDIHLICRSAGEIEGNADRGRPRASAGRDRCRGPPCLPRAWARLLPAAPRAR